MKAYVIKNKKGKYFCGFDDVIGLNIFSERIIDALNTQTPTKKHCQEEIKDYNLKDCEVVEITIAEGDLEKQLAEKDKIIKKLTDSLLLEDAYEAQKKNGFPAKKIDIVESVIRHIRHQVCEEIWRLFDNWYYNETQPNVRFYYKIREILDQIEKGESK